MAASSTPRLTVLYDGSCSICRASAERVRRFNSRGRIELLDLHHPSAPQRFPQIDREEAMKWMQAVDANGRIYSGADAWARIGLLLPGWKFVAWILLVPGVHFLSAKIYAWIARNRYRWNRSVCEDDSCRVHLGSHSSH
jgi:predicted DCC family thiol-disulfide oxidoreductase YuxK